VRYRRLPLTSAALDASLLHQVHAPKGAAGQLIAGREAHCSLARLEASPAASPGAAAGSAESHAY